MISYPINMRTKKMTEQDLRIDYLAARLCSAALPSQQYRMHFLMDDFVHESDNHHDWDVWVGEGAEHNFAVFRGYRATTPLSWKDIGSMIADYFRPLPGNDLKLYAPYFAAWQRMSPAVFRATNTIHYTQAEETGTSKPWVFTGHGLGGAMAQIAAASFKPATLVTFGTPRVGGKHFAEVLDDACTHRRWLSARDQGAVIPLAGHQMHSGDLFYIAGNWKLERNPSAMMQVLDHDKWFERHGIEAYVDFIEESFK